MSDPTAPYFRHGLTFSDLAGRFDNGLGGPLDWFSLMDDQGRVLWREPPNHELPMRPTAARGQRAWLKTLLAFARPHFFFELYRAGGDPKQVEELGQDAKGWRQLRLPLWDVLGLPGVDPMAELAQMRAFLTWVDAQADRYSPPLPENRISLQWFRGGYAERGLEWTGTRHLSPEDKAALDASLADWDAQPWFVAWKQHQLKRFSRVHIGPHCWLDLGDLRADRRTLYFRKEAGLPAQALDFEAPDADKPPAPSPRKAMPNP